MMDFMQVGVGAEADACPREAGDQGSGSAGGSRARGGHKSERGGATILLGLKGIPWPLLVGRSLVCNVEGCLAVVAGIFLLSTARPCRSHCALTDRFFLLLTDGLCLFAGARRRRGLPTS